MTDEKMTEHNHNSFLSKKLLMSGQHQHDFGNNETTHSFFPSSTQKQTNINVPSSQIMNIRNPLTALNYMSIFRPMPIDASQSSINNHFDAVNTTPSNQRIDSNSSPCTMQQPTNFFEEPTVLKINIPIEMIIRNIPQQLSSSPPSPLQQMPSSHQEQWDHRCNHPTHSWSTRQMPCQTASDWTSKPATALIRKAQEVFFGTNMNNDRGDVASKSSRRADLPTFDPRITNEMNKSLSIQQQQVKSSHKPFQGSQQQHHSMMPRCSDLSSPSCPKRCECESTLYPPM